MDNKSTFCNQTFRAGLQLQKMMSGKSVSYLATDVALLLTCCFMKTHSSHLPSAMVSNQNLSIVVNPQFPYDHIVDT